jgi:predicted nucleic acid-binding protein
VAIVVDAGVVIAVRDENDAHHVAASAAIRAFLSDELYLPATALAEALVAESMRGTASAARALIERMMVVHPLDAEVAEAAAAVRAETRLPLPDAIVLATAEVIDARIVLTTDRRWRKLPRVQVI